MAAQTKSTDTSIMEELRLRVNMKSIAQIIALAAAAALGWSFQSANAYGLLADVAAHSAAVAAFVVALVFAR